MSHKKTRYNKTMATIKEYAVLFLLVIIISVTIQTFIISTFKVNGDSMTPTLESNETMMMYKLGTPNRFDVVVIESPDVVYEYDALGNMKRDLFGNPIRRLYIKRVIGMPGDTLFYKDDTLYINDVPYEEPYLDKQRAQVSGVYMADSTLEEYMAYARQSIPNLPQENTVLADKQGKKVIPDGYYFVLGDNRLYSKDSQEYGLVKQELIKGTAILRFYPLDRIGIAPFNE